jgi:cell wall-associated NlpC family hydrolase
MINARHYSHVTALLAVLIGLVISLLTPSPTAAIDKEPLSTHTAFRPSWIPSIPEPIPDSRRNHRSIPVVVIPVHVPVVPSIRPVQSMTQPKQSLPIKKTAAPQRTPVTPAAKLSNATEVAIAYAMSKLGHAYVWGATGPNNFDCSGLVQAAFRSAGIQLPRTTKTIISRGTPVSRSAMQRGDLIWTSSGHIGIYLGGNKMIHSPQPGDVVKISTVWSFYAARRL